MASQQRQTRDEEERGAIIRETVSVDPVSFEVVRNALQSYCDDGFRIVETDSYSPVVTEGKDHSVGLHDADGRLVIHSKYCQSPHLGGFEDIAQTVLDRADSIEPGDVFIQNDPYVAGSHHNDMTFIKPVFVDGEIFALPAALVHWPDVGGPRPGTFNPTATDAWQEGLLIPTTKVAENDTEIIQDVWELIQGNIRSADERQAEFYAQLKAVNIVEERLHGLIEEKGKETVKAVMDESIKYQKRLFQRELDKLPDGTYEFVDYGDQDVNHPEKVPIKVHAELTIDGHDVTFDFAGSDDTPLSSWGFTKPALNGAVYDGTMHAFPNVLPFNHGIMEVLDIETRDGSCVDVDFPTPITGYCSGAFEKAVHVAMGCWDQAVIEVDPQRVNAGTINLANAVCSGQDDEGDPFVAYFWMEGGQGARPVADGVDYMMPVYGGGASNQSMEVFERHYPVVHTTFSTNVDSCGDGEYRGGMGAYRNFIALTEMETTCHGDREKFTPFGIGGGLNGGPNELKVRRKDGDIDQFGMFASGREIHVGDELIFGSNGGGGWGDPLDRDPEAVLSDVIDGFVSLEHARDTYGVEIVVNDEDTLDYEVDYEATEQLRDELTDREIEEGYEFRQVHPYGKLVQL